MSPTQGSKTKAGITQFSTRTRTTRSKAFKPDLRHQDAPLSAVRVLRSSMQAATASPPPTQPTPQEATKPRARRRRRTGADPWMPRRRPKPNPNPTPRPRVPPPTHFNCRICAEEQPVESFIKWLSQQQRLFRIAKDIPTNCIPHLSRNPRRKNDPVCKSCIGNSMAAQMETLGARKVGSGCLEPGCTEVWDANFILKYFPVAKLEAYNEGMMRVYLESVRTFSCLSPTCTFTGIIDPLAAGHPQVSCPDCQMRWCASCNIEWHTNLTCTDYAARNVHEKMTDPEKQTLELAQEKDGKRCPNCYMVIEKEGGCDSMFCTGCNTYFNWATAASAVPGKGAKTLPMGPVTGVYGALPGMVGACEVDALAGKMASEVAAAA